MDMYKHLNSDDFVLDDGMTDTSNSTSERVLSYFLLW